MYNFHLKICCFLIHSKNNREYHTKEENKDTNKRNHVNLTEYEYSHTS